MNKKLIKQIIIKTGILLIAAVFLCLITGQYIQALAKSSEQVSNKIYKITQKELPENLIKGKINSISSGKVSLDVGKNAGLKVGDILRLKRMKKVGRGLLPPVKKTVAEIELTIVEDTHAEAKPIKSYMSIKEGDFIEIEAPIVKKVKAKAEQKTELVKEQTIKVTATKKTPAPKQEKVLEPVAEIVPKKDTKIVIQETKAAKVAPVPAPAPESIPVEPAIIPEESNGILTLITEPAKAQIILDGASIGNSPKTIPDLKTGSHNVKISKSGYKDWSEVVAVDEGVETKFNIRLIPFGGKIKITYIPNKASIIIGKKNLGRTNKTLILSPGAYTIKLSKKGYAAFTQHITIKEGQTSSINVVLNPKGVEGIPGMIYISGGVFNMGSQNADPDEAPVHKVSLSSFYIDKKEVSNKQYQQFLEATKHRAPNFWGDEDLSKPNLPVIGVTWEEANAYCTWVEKRLPTEAEWEKAARGIDGRIYPWGKEFANGYANSYGKGDGYQFTAPVGSFTKGASPFGVLNMAGNVWEWCSDWYADDYYGKSPAQSPQGAAHGQWKVIRGGSWEDIAGKLRVSNRYAMPADYSAYNLGFRCAK